MNVLRTVTKDGGSAGIAMTAVQALEHDLRGSLLLPNAAGYEDARRI